MPIIRRTFIGYEITSDFGRAVIEYRSPDAYNVFAYSPEGAHSPHLEPDGPLNELQALEFALALFTI